MKIRFLIFCCIFFLVHSGFSQSIDFEKIDQHALNAPSSVGKSVERLADYLVKPAKNDHEKVRAFYVWITDNIAYDTKAFFSGSQKQYTADEVLQRKKAVCDGYATLFKTLCDLEDVTSMIIPGYSKGYGYNPSKPLDNTDHAWNAVQLNNQWYLLDVTWGSGHINEQNRFERSFTEEFFLVNPATFVYRHLPADPMWQLLKSPVSLQLFQKDSTQIKSYLLSADEYFNYADSIAAFMLLDETEQQIKSAYNEFQFNEKLSAPVGFGYMNKAYGLFKDLLENQDMDPALAYEKQEYILGLYEKALYYFELNNDPVSRDARKICKQNIQSCKDNLEVYKQRMERGM